MYYSQISAYQYKGLTSNDWIHKLSVHPGSEIPDTDKVKIGGDDVASILATRSNIINVQGDDGWTLEKFSDKFFSFCQHLKINARNANITIWPGSRVRKITLLQGSCTIFEGTFVEEVQLFTSIAAKLNLLGGYGQVKNQPDSRWNYYYKK